MLERMKALRYRIEYCLHAGLSQAGASTCRLEAAQRIGAASWAARPLGSAWPGQTTHENLRLRLGLQDKAQRRRVALQAYANFGQTFVEVARMPVTAPEDLEAWFEFENLDYLEPPRPRAKASCA